MDARTLRVLEFDKVRAMAVERAGTKLGKEIAAALEPSTDPGEIARRQQETSEARAILRGGKSFPLGGIHDLRESLAQATRGSSLEPTQLLDTADTIYAAARLKKFLLEMKNDYPLLSSLASAIGSFRALEEEIRSAITDKAEITDDASPELSRLRKNIRITHNRIREKLDSMIRSPETGKYLQDPIVTIRDDRFVVPVKQEYRGQVPGIVHDLSASGATLFVEPMAVVELNNDLRTLQGEEREEILRILRELTRRVAAQAPALRETAEALGQIDFIAAKARLSNDTDSVEPQMNAEGRIDIKRGRHPLLRGDVVPVDIHLGRDFDTLVITGPNTGGKTVALKTIGLFTVMAQSGFHVPAGFGTEIGIFDQVFCDVGDEQSIEQSLSTFSSHMTNIVRITDHMRGRALVLLDELGAGTDPTEGAALAMSILEFLHARGARTVATTHYSELKTFAYTRLRVENASVEFDVETLRPTYRLLIGLPGRSNAFEISARLGLKAEIVGRAREFLTKEEVKVERLIESIESNRIELEKERDLAERTRHETTKLRQEFERKKADLEGRQKEIVEKARREALDIVNRARREAEEVIRALRQEREEAAQDRAIQEARRRLQKSREELTQAEAAEPVEGEIPRGLKPGQPVFIATLGQRGYALSEPGPDGQVLVRAGILKLHVKLSDLRVVEEENAGVIPSGRVASRDGLMGLTSAKAQTMSPEVDLRGLTVEEAISKTDKFLDDAILAGLPQVRIIHGKGTGALRQAVKELLQAHRQIKGYHLGGAGEGGDGVTVAQLE